MRWATLLTLLSPLILSGLGCSSPGHSWRAYAGRNGGLLEDQHQIRADRVFARIVPSSGDGSHIYVLNASDIGAHALPDGNIFVTRALMDLLDDEELSAAIAHELAHLINDGHLHAVMSLRGCCETPEAEARADATGVELLRERGLDPRAMSRMLGKVKVTAELTPACRNAIGHRIELLSTRGDVRVSRPQN